MCVDNTAVKGNGYDQSLLDTANELLIGDLLTDTIIMDAEVAEKDTSNQADPSDLMCIDQPSDLQIADEPDMCLETSETQDAYEEVTPQKTEYVAAALSDYTKGAVVLFTDSLPEKVKTILTEENVGDDPVIRGFGPTLAVVNRYLGDNVQLFKTGSEEFSPLGTFFTGAGSNPQDAFLLDGGLLYNTVYATKDFEGNPVTINGNPISDILVFNSTTETIESQIDLTLYSKNGQANATTIIEANGKIYVTMQDLNGWKADTNGKVAVIDPVTDEVITKIDLECFNPVDMIYAEKQGKLFIACAGDFMMTDEANAGIETVDIASPTTFGLKIFEDAIGNNATKVRIVSDNLGVIATSNFNDKDISFVASFNPQTGKILNKKLYGNETTNVTDILVDKDGVLWIADRDTVSGGVVRVDPETGTILDYMPPLEMPPVSLTTVTLPEGM